MTTSSTYITEVQGVYLPWSLFKTAYKKQLLIAECCDVYETRNMEWDKVWKNLVSQSLFRMKEVDNVPISSVLLNAKRERLSDSNITYDS